MTSLGGALLAACGSDGEPDPQPDAGGGGSDAGFMGTCSSTSVQIGSNHSHTMVIEAADLDATSPREYDITGGSDHPHTVTITPAQFATLKQTGMLMVTSSSDDGHSHSIRVRCTA